jgi:hypothetical protein
VHELRASEIDGIGGASEFQKYQYNTDCNQYGIGERRALEESRDAIGDDIGDQGRGQPKQRFCGEVDP